MAILNGNWVEEFHSAFDAWDKQFLVTSNDIDGFLSAAAIIHHCRQEGAEPTLIGIYTGRHIALFDGHTTDDARKARFASCGAPRAALREGLLVGKAPWSGIVGPNSPFLRGLLVGKRDHDNFKFSAPKT